MMDRPAVTRRLTAAALVAAVLTSGCDLTGTGPDPVPAPTASPSVSVPSSPPAATASPALPEVTPAPVSPAPDLGVPQAVAQQAQVYLENAIQELQWQWDDLSWPEDAPVITGGSVVGLTPIPTGTAGLTDSVEVYHLEYQLDVEGDPTPYLTDGRRSQGGKLTGETDFGQPCLFLYTDESGTALMDALYDAEIEARFGAPGFLEGQYEDQYQAAAMELRSDYLAARSFDDVTVLDCGYPLEVAVPNAYRDDLDVRLGGDDLVAFYSKASVEAAAADGHADWGAGWLFSIIRLPRADFEQCTMASIPSYTFFASDTQHYYYALSTPTDVRFYPSAEAAPDGEFSGTDASLLLQQELALWGELCELAEPAAKDFLARNGLHPIDLYDMSIRYCYPGEHRVYRGSLSGDEEDSSYLVLSQPARQGEDGIWCVERMIQSHGWPSLWFPEHEFPSDLDFYSSVQDRHDQGEQTGYDTPEDAIRTYLESQWIEEPDPAAFLDLGNQTVLPFLDQYDFFPDSLYDAPTRFADGPKDEYTVPAVLTTQTPVQNFRFFGLALTDDDFEETGTRFTQAWFLPEHPIVLETSFPGDTPTCGIAYTLNGVEQRYALSMSGRDGSLVLTPIAEG